MLRQRGRMTRRAWISFVVLAVISASPSAAVAGGYKIRSGDTIWDIARKNHVSVNSLLSANGLKETSVLRIGRTLLIPGKPDKKCQQTDKHTRRVCKPVSASAHVRAEGVYLRCGPSTHQRVIAKLHAGTAVQVIGTCGAWRKVAVAGGAKGFIYAPLLSTGSKPYSASQAASAPVQTGDGLIRTALACRGARYSRGGTGRSGFDCSGFTRYVFAKYGVSLPHSSAAQASKGTPIPKSSLQPGDLVFFRTYRRGISHVGIYIGDDKFVHAATYGRGVRVDSLSHSYYAARYRGARRVR